jgi:hypothetical protein
MNVGFFPRNLGGLRDMTLRETSPALWLGLGFPHQNSFQQTRLRLGGALRASDSKVYELDKRGPR